MINQELLKLCFYLNVEIFAVIGFFLKISGASELSRICTLIYVKGASLFLIFYAGIEICKILKLI
jgi:hypothetical protein